MASEAESCSLAVSTSKNQRTKDKLSCYFCGRSPHNRNSCPAREATCFRCGKRGHFSKICTGKATKGMSEVSQRCLFVFPDTRNTYLASVVAGAPGCLKSAVIQAKINGISISALVDSCASENFFDKRLVDNLQLKIEGSSSDITMALTKLLVPTHGKTHACLSLLNRNYKNTSFEIIDGLCADVILGQRFLKRHRSCFSNGWCRKDACNS